MSRIYRQLRTTHLYNFPNCVGVSRDLGFHFHSRWNLLRTRFTQFTLGNRKFLQINRLVPPCLPFGEPLLRMRMTHTRKYASASHYSEPSDAICRVFPDKNDRKAVREG